MFFSLFILIITGGVVVAAECPSKCKCYDGKRVFCTSKGIQDDELESILSVLDKEATTTLALYDNNLTMSKSNKFSEVVNLEFLNLEKNVISNVEDNAMQGLAKLQKLEIASNLIENINGKVFRDVPNLENLDLSYNKFTRVNQDLFSNLKSLKKLRLDANQIEILDENSFKHLNLERLSLVGNSISKLSPKMFTGSNVVEIDLTSNPIECTCKTYFDLSGMSSIVKKIYGRCEKKGETITKFIKENPKNCTMCLLKPCKHNGVCTATNANNDYKCTCTKGYEGKNCEEVLEDKERNGGLSGTTIGEIVVFVVLAILLIVVGVIYWKGKQRNRLKNDRIALFENKPVYS